jgi:uncharacterized protein YodC (DUF2158 family)
MEITAGDVVCLKAHPAQVMTVLEVSGDWITCQWSNDWSHQELAFPISRLHKIDPADETES